MSDTAKPKTDSIYPDPETDLDSDTESGADEAQSENSKFAVTSPDFKYSSSYNMYWEKIHNPPPAMKGLIFGDHDTEKHQGHWRQQFKQPGQVLHVEIGCNAGHVTLEWAKQNPNQLYIGIDWKFKMAFKFAEKVVKNDLRNCLVFRANAERLPFMFAPGEINFLHMFFPDPWPKKAQKKNRTANATWMRSIAPLLSNDGVFHLKTDHAEYFEFILEELKTLTDVFKIVEMTKDLHAHNPEAKKLTIPDVTLFERLFIKDGLPIHSVKLKKA